MLLRYFRKIDAYSGIRVFAAAVVVFAVIFSTGTGGWKEVILSFGLGAAWLWLSWTLLRDRWVIKTSALRFMTFLLLSIYWSVEFEISTLLFYVLIVEVNWHLAENHKRKASVLYVLHSGTLTALSSYWLPQETIYSMIGALMIWFASGGIRFKTILQWLLAWSMTMAPMTYLMVKQGVEKVDLADAPFTWWVLPLVLMIVAVFEWVQSYMKANQKNKSRSIVGGLLIVIGGIMGWWFGSFFGISICLLGLSYHLANRLRYFKRQTIAEILFAVVLIFIVVVHYDVIPW